MVSRLRGKRNTTKRPPARNPRRKGRIMGVSGGQPRMVVGLSRSYMPPVYYTKLRYQQFQTLNSAPALATQVIRANSLFDPNLTGVGHQPRGFDQLAGSYKEYRVYGVLFDVSFKVTTGAYAYVGYSLIAHNQSGPTSINGAIECRRSYNKLINSTDIHRIRKYVPIHSADGVSKAVVNTDDNYKALVTANPAIGPAIQFHAGSPDETTTTVVHCNYTLTYFCAFTSPTLLSQS